MGAAAVTSQSSLIFQAMMETENTLPFSRAGQPSARGNAFTFTKLLVVIFIMAILAALLLLALARFHIKGPQVQCLSNVRQLCSGGHAASAIARQLSGRSKFPRLFLGAGALHGGELTNSAIRLLDFCPDLQPLANIDPLQLRKSG
jgi:hypothetical protein